MNPRSARALAAAIVLLAFASAFGMQRYHDDWVMADAVLRAARASGTWAFATAPFGQHWSPIWMAFEAINARIVGVQSDLLIRSLVVMLALAALLVFARTARRCTLGATATAAGMATLGLHHLNAIGYYSFDCFSQVAVDLIAWTSLGLAMEAAREDAAARARRALGGALALFAVGLFVKEQALAVVAGLVAVSLWYSVVEPIERVRRNDLWIATGVAFAGAAVFAVLRWRAGLLMDAEGPFSVCLSCVPGNIGLLLGATLLPFNTIDVYLALANPRELFPLLAAAGGGATLVVLLLVGGMVALRRAHAGAPPIGLLLLLAVSSTFPAAVLTHVGELYAHAPLFWFALIVACAAEGWQIRLRGRVGRSLVAGASVLYAASLFVGLQANLAEMRRAGARAHAWIAAFDRALAKAPAGSLVLVRGLGDLKGASDYSLYRLTLPGMLLSGTAGLTASIRPDLEIEEAEQNLGAQRARLGGAPTRPVFIADVGSAVQVRRWDSDRGPQ